MSMSQNSSKTLNFTTDDCEAIVELLRKNCSLLDLPLQALESVLAYYGECAGEEIVDQVKRRAGSLSLEDLDAKLKNLRKLEGGDGFAVDCYMVKAEYDLKKQLKCQARGAGILNSCIKGRYGRCKWIEYASTWDERMLQSLQSLLSPTCGLSVVGAWVDKMRELRSQSSSFVSPNLKDSRGSVYLSNQPVWKRSLPFLRRIHIRQLGPKLVDRIAGHVLPVEMMDFIIEYLEEATMAEFDESQTLFCIDLDDGSTLREVNAIKLNTATRRARNKRGLVEKTS